MRAEETNADVILFGAKRYNTATKTTEEAPWYFNRKHLPRGKEVFSRDDCPDKIMRLTSPAPWTKLYRSDFIRQQDLKFQGLQNSNDAFFTLLAISIAERISYVNEDLVYYRIGQASNLQSGVLDHEEDYYENKKNYYKVKSCIAAWQQHIRGGVIGLIRSRTV